jgi:two-component system, NtrC family, sensor kinase
MYDVVNLKKLLFRKEFTLITDLIQALDPSVSVHLVNGEVLFGPAAAATELLPGLPLELPTTFVPSPQCCPIAVESVVHGWVMGQRKAPAIAALLSHLATREAEKRTLAQELLTKYKEISLLFNLSERVIDSLDVEDVSLLTLDEACRLLEADRGAVFLRAEAGTIKCVATLGGVVVADTLNDLGTNSWSSLVTLGRGEIVNDVAQDQRYCSITMEDIVSLIIVPLKSKERLMGTIVLMRSHDKPFTAEDLKMFTTLACQASGIVGALLHERKLKESRQNDLVFRLSSQIRDSLELSVILETAVKEIQMVMHLDRCMFLWCEMQGEMLMPLRSTSVTAIMSPKCSSTDMHALNIVTEAKADNVPTLIGTYPAATVGGLAAVLLNQVQVRIDDVERYKEAELCIFLREQGFGAFLAMPISTRSGRIGVLGCATHGLPRLWTDDEVSLLRSVSNQLAIALDQSELYEQSRVAAAIAEDKAQQLEQALTQLQTAQMQLVQSEKMSSLGQMVAGIAHEINNPVNFIHGNLPYMGEYMRHLMELINCYQQEYPHPSSNIQSKAAQIDLDFLLSDLPKLQQSMTLGTERIQDIVLSLRNFSRLDEADCKTVDLHEGLDSTLLMLEHRLKPYSPFPGITVQKYYGNLPLVECYPGQLNQVFMNLFTNAIDALEEAALKQPQQHSTLNLSIHTEQLDEAQVLICITDNGLGIPAAIVSKLFDPFFTTKPVGKGTGLGLSISYQIITESHQGDLSYHPNPLGGSAFAITLPIVQPHKIVSPR